ncbi:MAG: VWA domain-containing protein [Chloroflexota bacterium]
MFTEFFYLLRKHKVPVSVTEWMTLMEALAGGHIRNLDDFYFLARAILVKSESFFDQYDVTFQEYFTGVETPAEILEQVLDWLRDPLARLPFSAEQGALLQKFKFDELLRELEKRLQEQNSQHDGGSYWVGRGGISPFGHSGYHPAGIRIGGEGGGRGAIQIAQERRYRNYRNDLVLDVRQTRVALRGLRRLSRIGEAEELDLDKTIKATAQNAGELEFIWARSRKNNIKLLLLMDVGGSMDPYALMCSQLFSAAHSSTHFKEFKYYYFHNCLYDHVYKDMERRDAVSTASLLETTEPDYKVLFVGDARMAPYELTERWGAIDYWERNEMTGLARLESFRNHFTHAVWLNPEETRYWIHPTVRTVGALFPMYQLTLEGLGEAVRKLIVKR